MIKLYKVTFMLQLGEEIETLDEVKDFVEENMVIGLEPGEEIYNIEVEQK